MLGTYENFPQITHCIKIFASDLPKRKLQQLVVQKLEELNRKELSFEEICGPSLPNATVILEFGIADEYGFNFLNEDEAKKVQDALLKEPMDVMDWFCSLRYYRNLEKKSALRFDYCLLRLIFEEKDTVEFQVFHERGPRHVSPDDLAEYIVRTLNMTLKKKILRLIGSGD